MEKYRICSGCCIFFFSLRLKIALRMPEPVVIVMERFYAAINFETQIGHNTCHDFYKKQQSNY